MSLIKGPFELKWGANTITDVEEISVEHSIASDDFETVQGRTIELDGAFKVSATITLLASDIPALAVLLPQHFVANGAVMSTGETVSDADGAIDVAPSACEDATVYNDLDIMSCADPSQVFRIVNARTKIDGIEIDNKIRKVMIKFVGESAQDEATVQFFKEGTINVVS